MARKRSSRPVASLKSDGRSVEVLVVKMVFSGAALPTVDQMSFFSSTFSGTASMTRSASETASARSLDCERRSRVSLMRSSVASSRPLA